MTDPLSKTRAEAAAREELLAPLTASQRIRALDLYLRTPWDLPECVRRVTLSDADLPLCPAELDRILEAVRRVPEEEPPAPEDPPEPSWWARPLLWAYGKACDAYASLLLRSPTFTPVELRDLHLQAGEELPPKTAARAQRLILREIERRARKEY